LQSSAPAPSFSPSARLLGMGAALGTLLAGGCYAILLVAGLASLPSPGKPIGDPLFSILEILIILMMPLMVALMVAVHAWAPVARKVYSLLALIFMSLLAGLTSGVHFVILTVGHVAAFEGLEAMPRFLSFRWPSVVYALDILGWDVFFGVAMLSAAAVFDGSVLCRWIRLLLVAAGVLALAGLAGVATGDMRLRNIGILGYAGAFPCVALLLAILFRRAPPQRTRTQASAAIRISDLPKLRPVSTRASERGA
jgi:hypothetical protein